MQVKLQNICFTTSHTLIVQCIKAIIIPSKPIFSIFFIQIRPSRPTSSNFDDKKNYFTYTLTFKIYVYKKNIGNSRIMFRKRKNKNI